MEHASHDWNCSQGAKSDYEDKSKHVTGRAIRFAQTRNRKPEDCAVAAKSQEVDIKFKEQGIHSVKTYWPQMTRWNKIANVRHLRTGTGIVIRLPSIQ